MSRRGEVLVAIINKQLDFAILRKYLWYRIPVSSEKKWLRDCWPPKWMAFYQTKAFGVEKYAVNFWGDVENIREVRRSELFPDEPRDERSDRPYHRIALKSLERLQEPITSAHGRRLIFIPTTYAKFHAAREINDLYAGSSLEERLWEVLKARRIPAEREVFVTARGHEYALDFAVYCALGRLALETDGDLWHANPEKSVEDNLRDQDLETRGWRVLHFTQSQIQEQAAKYCIDTVVENIEQLGGLDEGGVTPRRVGPAAGPYQPSLFE